MSVTKVLRNTTVEDLETVEINKLRDEWNAARRQLDTLVMAGECCVSACRTMPFVVLKTKIGRRSLCLRHFEKLNEATPV